MRFIIFPIFFWNKLLQFQQIMRKLLLYILIHFVQTDITYFHSQFTRDVLTKVLWFAVYIFQRALNKMSQNYKYIFSTINCTCMTVYKIITRINIVINGQEIKLYSVEFKTRFEKYLFDNVQVVFW